MGEREVTTGSAHYSMENTLSLGLSHPDPQLRLIGETIRRKVHAYLYMLSSVLRSVIDTGQTSTFIYRGEFPYIPIQL